MIIKYNTKKYFFYDNQFFQTTLEGDLDFNHPNIKTEKEAREFLEKRECYTRESIVTKHGNSGRLAAPSYLIDERVFYVIASLDPESAYKKKHKIQE